MDSPHTRTHTHTDPSDNTIRPPETLISLGDCSMGGRLKKRRRGRAKERRGVIDGKWGCFTAHWRCFPWPAVSALSSWLPDGVSNTRGTISLFIMSVRVCVCVFQDTLLTRTGGWVGPMVHLQAISLTGCFAASCSTNT